MLQIELTKEQYLNLLEMNHIANSVLGYFGRCPARNRIQEKIR